MRVGGVALVALLCLVAVESRSHDLQHRIERSEGVIVSFFFGNGEPFSYEAFEIYREGETIAFQTGRSDALGRILFLPDRAGAWRIKVYSEDGHGGEFVVSVDEHLQASNRDAPLFSRHIRIFVGIGVILGVFGCISLVRRKTK
jgi:nickel transport protein